MRVKRRYLRLLSLGLIIAASTPTVAETSRRHHVGERGEHQRQLHYNKAPRVIHRPLYLSRQQSQHKTTKHRHNTQMVQKPRHSHRYPNIRRDRRGYYFSGYGFIAHGHRHHPHCPEWHAEAFVVALGLSLIFND